MGYRLIRFHYYEWTPQKEMHLRRNGETYEISPWGLTWDDENYYMVGYDGEAEMIKHFRVDKMLDIEITDQLREGKERFEKFDLASYAKKVFGMFSGEERMVRMICENKFAGAMIDRFGREVMMHPVDEGHFSVSAAVKVKASGGIRDAETARRMIEAGAERLGTSRSLSICREAAEKD